MVMRYYGCFRKEAEYMFQSRVQRKSASEVHLCEFCKKKGKCKFEPEKTQWRYVLKFCQNYEEKELDYFTGGYYSR